MNEASSGDELEQILQHSDYTFRFDCGFSRVITMENKHEFMSVVWKHFVLYSIYAELTEFRNGLLNTLNLKHLATVSPREGANKMYQTALALSPGHSPPQSGLGMGLQTALAVLQWEPRNEAFKAYVEVIHLGWIQNHTCWSCVDTCSTKVGGMRGECVNTSHITNIMDQDLYVAA